MSSTETFLNKLTTAKRKCGLYLFDDFLSREECRDYLTTLDSNEFPWNLKPRLYGKALPQHAYKHNDRRSKSTRKKISGSVGLKKLEELCVKIETEFDGNVTDVFCNRFEDPGHAIDWHRDTYGRHIFVLSLGSERTVEWRDSKTREIEQITPSEGSVYFMPLGLNSTHKHRVCSAEETNSTNTDGTRISFVFFFEPPKYAKDFKIKSMDRFIGFVESVLS